MKEDIPVAELRSQVPLKENTRVNESAEPTLSCIYFGQMSAFHMKIGGTQETPVSELQSSHIGWLPTCSMQIGEEPPLVTHEAISSTLNIFISWSSKMKYALK